MDNAQKQRIIELRFQGYKLSDIADEVGLNVSTVKSFCSRHNLLPGVKVCKNCCKPLQSGYKFCSSDCREEWWSSNRKLIYSNKYKFTCECCGKEFYSHRSDHHKYCSKQCYFDSRYGGKDNG